MLRLPVAGGGKVCDPLLAERLVEENRLDAVYVGRQLFADPDFPEKYFEGRRDDIRMCLSCDVCTLRLFNQWEVKCSVNPDFGPYKNQPLERAKRPRKVLVVGGGVAGMEAGRLASQMGHEVTLCEKDGELGGIVKAVADIPRLYTADLGNIVDWQKCQIATAAVDVRLNTEVTPELVSEIKPDAVILATGVKFLDKEHQAHTVAADTVVLAVDHCPNKKLAEALEGKVCQIYQIGDCVAPGRIYEAIHSAHHIVRDALGQFFSPTVSPNKTAFWILEEQLRGILKLTPLRSVVILK